MRPLKLLSTLLWLLISFSGLLKGNTIIQPDCVTPSNALGKCIEVRYCVSIVAAITNNDHLTNPKVSQYLRESQCGIQRGSHKVCCDINDIDYGDETLNATETTTSRLSSILLPPNEFKRLSDIEKCGKLERNETPKKWVGELWFKIKGVSKTQLKSKCLGTLISHKHLIVPARCVASLPANVTLDFVEVGNFEKSVSKIFIHASYNQPKFANDIAIIELDEENGDEINDAVCLPESTSNAISSIAILKRESESVKFGKVHSIADGNCSSFYNQQFPQLSVGQYCAKIQSNETAYTPFIGAIVLESDKNRQYFFKGFSSTTLGTDHNFDENKPYVFTDLSYHIKWIRAAIGNELVKNSPNSSRIVEPTPNTPLCQMSTGSGFCVEFQQCSLYRNAPQPFSQQRTEVLNQVKCFTTLLNNVNEDGVCCPKKYVEMNNTNNFDIRLQEGKQKRGVELLDMKTCGKVSSRKRIVGGSKAELQEFPWISLVKYKVGRIFKFTCGASLISNLYVLTCAHCITNLPKSFQVVAVRLGEYNLSTDPDCITVEENQQECNQPVQDINIAKLIPHPKYNEPRYSNDVALIRLIESPDMTKGIIPICLPINDEMQETISPKFTVAGFGFTEDLQNSDILRKVHLPKVDKETCQSFHNSMIILSDGHECYGGEGTRDSCKGDSGNGIYNYVNLNGKIKTVQYGIVAAGNSDCGRGASGFPGIYSDVKFYLDWILGQMES